MAQLGIPTNKWFGQVSSLDFFLFEMNFCLTKAYYFEYVSFQKIDYRIELCRMCVKGIDIRKQHKGISKVVFPTLGIYFTSIVAIYLCLCITSIYYPKTQWLKQ